MVTVTVPGITPGRTVFIENSLELVNVIVAGTLPAGICADQLVYEDPVVVSVIFIKNPWQPFGCED